MKQFFLRPGSSPFLEIRTTLHSVMPYDVHFHADFSLGIILEGTTRFLLEGEPHIAETGDIVLIAPGQVHSCNPVNGRPRGYHMLFFNEAWYEAAIAGPSQGGCALTPQHPVISSPALHAEVVSLVAAAASGPENMEERFTAFLLSVLRDSGARPTQPGAGKVHGRVPAVYSSLRDTDGTEVNSIAALAGKANMRRESFSRLFRRKTGLPPKAYLHCLRIEKGRRLLRQGKSIAEAALETGYTDQSHFHRMFVRICSATPGCYRKNRSHLYKKQARQGR